MRPEVYIARNNVKTFLMSPFTFIILILFFPLALISQKAEWKVFNCSNMPQSVCSLKFRNFDIDAANVKWINTGGPLIKFDDINWSIIELSDSCQYFYPDRINVDNLGGVWLMDYQSFCGDFTVYKNGVFKYYLCTYYPVSFDIDNRNRVWIYSNSGPNYYMKLLQIRSAIDFSYLGTYPGGYGRIKCLKNDDVWIGISEPIKRLMLIRDSTYQYFDSSNTNIQSLGFIDACSDNDGFAWFAISSGVLKYDNIHFTAYDSTNSVFSGISWSVTCDPDNRIWLGTDSGLVKFDTLNCQIFNTSNSPLPSNKIIQVKADMFGNKWMICEDTPNNKNYLCVYREGGVMLNTAENYYSSGNNVEVYPNPTYAECIMRMRARDGLVNVIELYDVQGRLVQSTTTKESEAVIDISQLPAGVYYCVVSNEKYKETVKVVKM